MTPHSPHSMTGIEIQAHLQKLGLLAQVAMTIPTDELLSMYSHNDAIGWAIDPTAYRDNMENTRANEAMVRALGEFQTAIRKHWPAVAAIGSGDD